MANKYFPNLKNAIDYADVTQIIDGFNAVETDMNYTDGKIETVEAEIENVKFLQINMSELDSFFEEGAAVVSEQTDDISGYGGMRYFKRHLLLSTKYYEIYDTRGDGNYYQDGYERYRQTLYCWDGSIKTRNYVYTSGWTDWEDISVSKAYIEKEIGGISAALDEIISIQNTLIGGAET